VAFRANINQPVRSSINTRNPPKTHTRIPAERWYNTSTSQPGHYKPTAYKGEFDPDNSQNAAKAID